MPRTGLLVLALLLFPLAAAHGETPQQDDPPQSDAKPLVQPITRQPDLLSFGLGYAGFDKFNNIYSQDGEAHTRVTDARLEYRFGSTIGTAQDGDWLDFAIHPLAGLEGSSHKQLYGFGGLGFDFLLWKHVVVTESEAVGLFDSGNAKPLGSIIEFRSQLEAGWRFDNDIRATAYVGHISNAGITHRNPGEELAGGYIHVPVKMLFGE